MYIHLKINYILEPNYVVEFIDNIYLIFIDNISMNIKYFIKYITMKMRVIIYYHNIFYEIKYIYDSIFMTSVNSKYIFNKKEISIYILN